MSDTKESLDRTGYNPLTERQKANRPWGPAKDYKTVTDLSNLKNVIRIEAEYVGPSSTGRKDDGGKSRVDLLDPEFLVDVGHILRFGSEKYSAHNWRGGIAVSRLIAAALRHLFAICRGEDIDAESGYPHSAHLGCTVMFLHWMLIHRKDLDDRYKY